jgi:hypothetical protein
LITNCKWAPDSKAIYALLEEEAGRRELDRIDVLTGDKERLSGDGYSVVNYDVDNRGLLYSADQLIAAKSPNDNGDVEVVDTVRGFGFAKLLWPLTRPKRFLFRSDDRGVRPLLPAPVSLGWGTFSISPDGQKVISLVPVMETPDAWKRYLPGAPITPIFRSASALSESATGILRYEIVDLRTDSRQPLFDSPSGAEVGYYDSQQVLWSPDGDHAIVTNTFLPWEDQTPEEEVARRRPCAAAYDDIDSGGATCIVFARSSKEQELADSWG